MQQEDYDIPIEEQMDIEVIDDDDVTMEEVRPKRKLNDAKATPSAVKKQKIKIHNS